MLVIITSHLSVLLRRDHRLATLPPRRPDDRVTVVGLVEDVGIRLMGIDQRLGSRDVGLLAPRQEELDRVPQGIDGDVDLGREAAPRAAQRLFVDYARFFWAPAACW